MRRFFGPAAFALLGAWGLLSSAGACGGDGDLAPGQGPSMSSGSSMSGTGASGPGGATSTSTTATTTSTTASGPGGAGGASTSTGAAGGSSTSTGAAGGSSTGSGGGGGAAPGSPCNWGDDCGLGLFCDAPGCGAGMCALRPIPAAVHGDPMPVCGCDGVTYWNPDVAAYDGVATMAQGVCAAGMVCGKGMPCKGGLRCNTPVADASQCGAKSMGTCWGVPISCPVMGAGAKACTNQQCATICELIQSQNPYFDDGTCP